MAEYMKNVVRNSIGDDSFLFLMNAFAEKAKGPSHAMLREWLTRLVPILRSCMHPSNPVSHSDVMIQQPVAEIARETVDQGVQTEERTMESSANIHALDKALQDTQVELHQTKQELLESHQRHQTKVHEVEGLRLKISQQVDDIKNLHSQVAHNLFLSRCVMFVSFRLLLLNLQDSRE